MGTTSLRRFDVNLRSLSSEAEGSNSYAVGYAETIATIGVFASVIRAGEATFRSAVSLAGALPVADSWELASSDLSEAIRSDAGYYFSVPVLHSLRARVCSHSATAM